MIEKEGFVCGTSMLGTKEEQGMVAGCAHRAQPKRGQE